jgi:hypothetical protein
LDEVHYKYSPRYQLLEMMALGFLGFIIPLSIGHPQLLVGVAVNALLIRSALSLPSYRTLPIVFTPTLGVLARGILFGPFTVFLVFMMPFIWAGNYLLIYAFKAKLKYNYNYGLTLILASAAKAGMLYSAAVALHAANIIPEVFLSAMGLMQFTTAIIGGIIAYPWLNK